MEYIRTKKRHTWNQRKLQKTLLLETLELNYGYITQLDFI